MGPMGPMGRMGVMGRGRMTNDQFLMTNSEWRMTKLDDGKPSEVR